MAAKVALICALACAIQGLNGAVLVRQEAPVLTSGLYNDALSYLQTVEKEYGRIVDAFENVVANSEAEGPEAEFGGYFENIMKYFEDFAREHLGEEAEGNVDREVVRACIREQRPNFQKLAALIRQRIIDARVQLRQIIFDTLGPFVQRAREAFRAIVEEIARFPSRILQCIEERDFAKIIQVIRETRETVRKYAAVIRETLAEARQKFPMIREKAREMREQIAKEARAGLQVIREAVRQCIANGGPKSFALPAVPAVANAIGSVEEVANPIVPEEQVSTLVAPADAAVTNDL